VRFHWYWPFAREEELGWAQGVAQDGDSVVVQVIDREAAPPAGTTGNVTVRRDLPDVDRSASGIRWIPSRARTYLARSRQRRNAWTTDAYDLVHLHYVNRFTDALARTPRPLVISVHDVTPHVARLGALERPLARRVYRRADALVVHHATLKARLIDEFDVDDERVFVVPHQVFPSPLAGEPPAATPTLLFFGALRANKGLADLVEAFAQLPGDGLRLIIAGRGDADQEALARGAAASDPRISAEIGFVSLDRKRELFREASLIVLPYRSFASQSGVLHDAYAQGRPVVATRVGALGDTVDEDGTGIVVPVSDPAALATGITEALDADAWSRSAAASAAIRVDRSPHQTGQRLRAAYDSIV